VRGNAAAERGCAHQRPRDICGSGRHDPVHNFSNRIGHQYELQRGCDTTHAGYHFLRQHDGGHQQRRSDAGRGGSEHCGGSRYGAGHGRRLCDQDRWREVPPRQRHFRSYRIAGSRHLSGEPQQRDIVEQRHHSGKLGRAAMVLDGGGRLLAPLIAAPASAAAPWPEINALWTLYSGIKDKPTDAGTYSMGASWLDTTNKKIYVRTFDNRHPTGLNSDIDNLSNLSTLRGAETALTANHTIWMRGGCFMGGFNGAMVAASTNTSRLTYYADDMVFYGGYGFGAFTTIIAGASATAGGTKSVLNNCKAYYALLDGFNYHGNGTVATATSPFGIEIGCKSKWCGWTTGLANNGTTCHEACRLLCINSEYLNAQDRTINDIQSAMRWMLGCAGSTRRTADASVQSRIVCAQLSGNPGTCTIWLDTFTPLDGAFGPPQAQYEANTVTTAIGVVNFATNMSLPSAPSGGGTFAAYTP
jgi:hypothetical protein